MNAFRLTAVAVLSVLVIAIQTAHADETLRYAQGHTETVRVKASGQVQSGALDYPPSIIESGTAYSRAQVPADLMRAEAADLGASGEKDTPAVANRSPGRFEDGGASDTLGVAINLNGNRLWNL